MMPNNKFIPAPHGQLEYIIDTPKEIKHADTIMVICHPHPLHEGSMYNKVVTTLSRAAREMGIPALRFNFRGVQQSTGSYGEGRGELEDLHTVVDWLQANSPEQKIILAGFSFGGSVAYKGCLELKNVTHLITIAPAIVNFPVNEYPEPTVPWLTIQGNDDDVVSPQAVLQWLTQSITTPYHLITMNDVGHFFHGRLIELRKEIESFLQPRF